MCVSDVVFSLTSSLVSPSLVSSSLVSPFFSPSLVSAGAGSGSLGAAVLEGNSKLDFWALSKAFLKSLATVEGLVSFGLTQG